MAAVGVLLPSHRFEFSTRMSDDAAPLRSARVNNSICMDSPTSESYRERLRTDSCFGMPVSPWQQNSQASDPAAQLHFARIQQLLQVQYMLHTAQASIGALVSLCCFAASSLVPPMLPMQVPMQAQQMAPSQAMQPLPTLLEAPPLKQAQKSTLNFAAATGAEERVRGTDVSRTTLMLRGLPEAFTRDKLLALLDDRGLASRYDFVYLPFDFDSNTNLTHAFINMCTPADTELLFAKFDGLSDWGVPTDCICSVAWNDNQEGLASLLERYKNSPVMHKSVPDKFKPVLLRSGRIHPFPAPTQAIRAPKFRKRA